MSKSEENLREAFAGESQANRKYRQTILKKPLPVKPTNSKACIRK
jgi:hypothetical protein